jgi:hypothetical protein
MPNRANVTAYKCECGKTYKHLSTLSAHRRKCVVRPADASVSVTADMFMRVLEDNKELRSVLCQQQEHMKQQQLQMREQQEQIKEQQKQMAELLPRVGNTTHNNQKFNLQLFLNESCKEAVNWHEFVEGLSVNLDDVSTPTSSDLTAGVARAICHGMQNLGVYRRPIHCIDAKRKKLCIKQEDAWCDSEDGVATTINQAATSLRAKYDTLMSEWTEEHPNWQDSETETEIYISLLTRATGTIDVRRYTTELARNATIPKEPRPGD